LIEYSLYYIPINENITNQIAKPIIAPNPADFAFKGDLS